MPIIFKTNACGLCEDKPHMERTTVTRREAIKGAAALALVSASDAQAEMRGFESHNRLFARYILPNAQLEELATGFRWIEGPVWMGDAGCLLFQDLPNNRTMRWIEGLGTSVYRAPSNYANGQTRDREGRLVSCSHRSRCLYRTEHDGRITTLVERHGGKRLNSPNDVIVKSDGSIWFTDPVFGIVNDYEGGRQEPEQPPAVYRFEPKSGEIRIVAGDFDGPNGLAFSPDERLLYIAEAGTPNVDVPKQYIRVFQVQPDGVTLKGGDIFHKVEPGFSDGFRVDEDGNIWSSASDGVHCISPRGELLGKVFVPHVVGNVTFGGLARNRLFIGASTTLYSIYLNTRGVQMP
jgi:gluconolactonase